MNRKPALCCAQTSHVRIQTSQTVVITTICPSRSLPLCFVIYGIHRLDFKQPDAVCWLLGLTVKMPLKLQTPHRTLGNYCPGEVPRAQWKMGSEHFDLLWTSLIQPLPLLAHQLQLLLLRLPALCLLISSSLHFTWFIQLPSSSSLSSSLSKEAQDPATTTLWLCYYLQTFCTINHSYLDMFFLCPSPI